MQHGARHSTARVQPQHRHRELDDFVKVESFTSSYTCQICRDCFEAVINVVDDVLSYLCFFHS